MQPQSTTLNTRFSIENLIINSQSVAPNENPNKKLENSVTKVNIAFDPFKKSLAIDSDINRKSGIHYKNVKLIRDPKTVPSEDNQTIGLACLLCVTNDQFDSIENFSIGPNLKSSPGKISFAGGLFKLSDITPEHTVIREFIEELELDTYYPFDIINHIEKNMKLTHLIFSHPLIKHGPKETRRFNITFVYSIALPDYYLNVFKCDVSKKSEVDSVVTFKGNAILKSLISNSPFEIDKGWTINSTIIVLDYIKTVVKNQYDTLIKNGSNPDDPLVNVLSVFSTIPTTEISSEHDIRMVLKLCIQQLYVLLPKKKQAKILNPLIDQKLTSGELKKLVCPITSRLLISNLNRQTNVKAVANDMIAIFLYEAVYDKKFDFYIYDSKENVDYLFKKQRFHEITKALFILLMGSQYLKFAIDVNVTSIYGGHPDPEEKGWTISLSRKK
jgi:hypothetical protein